MICKYCTFNKERIFKKYHRSPSTNNITKTRKKYHDNSGRLWHGAKCPDCASDVRNRLHNKGYAKAYRDKTKDNPEVKKRASLATQNYRRNNPLEKLKHLLRARLKTALKGNFKTGSAVRDLGCTIEFLKLWLEAQFQHGMTWENHGNRKGQWSIDHIYPLSKVNLNNREDVLRVCNYQNLQPLWYIDNIKKSNLTHF